MSDLKEGLCAVIEQFEYAAKQAAKDLNEISELPQEKIDGHIVHQYGFIQGKLSCYAEMAERLKEIL